jgi:hypothetical protein
MFIASKFRGQFGNQFFGNLLGGFQKVRYLASFIHVFVDPLRVLLQTISFGTLITPSPKPKGKKKKRTQTLLILKVERNTKEKEFKSIFPLEKLAIEIPKILDGFDHQVLIYV